MLRTIRTRRHACCVLALGLTLSVAPVWGETTPVTAQAPATAVTGLSRGDRGDAVRSVQQALVNQGITPDGGVDGIFGPGTETALKSFQERQSLSPSGVVDDATALALGLASSPLLGLTQGVRGAEVERLQQALIDAGVTPDGGVDGIFGPATTAALETFQRREGHAVTGTVHARSAAALGRVQAGSGSGGSGSDSGSTTDGGSDDQGDAGAAGDSDGSGGSLVGLKIGARGDAVKTVQRTIMHAGFTLVGGDDGIFGVLTANALRSFQNANGLEVTGVVDRATADVLAVVGTGDDTGGSGGGSGSDDHDPTVTSSPLLGLRYGSLGSDVQALQRAIMDAGVSLFGGADGVFGPATQKALKQYQTSRGLDATGEVDEATANALASGAGSSNGPSSPLVGLKAGALGTTVQQLQQAIMDAGVSLRGGADGIFGPATHAALESFQTSQGLEATGVVDQATAAALAEPSPVGADGGNSVGGQAAGGYAEFGERGERVVAVQSALVKAGIALRGGVDGDFGSATSAAVMEFQRRQGLSVTGKVNDGTAAALGISEAPAPAEPDASSVELEVFPVQGRCYYGDSWHYPRGGGRLHLGVDIIGDEGLLLYAVADGRITKVYNDHPGSLAGNGVRLTTDDGTYFFYAHMGELAEGIELGVPVRAGQVLGTLGNTGNSGTPHLHFEVHPQGGAAVNPYPLVKAIDACDVTEPRS